jgi:hypothetical protein
MSFSRRVHERRQRREEKRRQAELERRQAADIERQQEEERREAARLEAEARNAELDAARERRNAMLLRLRTQILAERRTDAERAERRDALLEILRAARQQARQAELDESEKRTALRRSLSEARRDEQREAEDAEARRAAARRLRLEAQLAAEQSAEQASAEREAARRERLAEEQAALQAQAARQESSTARRQRQKVEERQEALRQSKRAERQAGEEDAKTKAAQRDAARQASRSGASEAKRASARRQDLREAQRAAERSTAQREARRTTRSEALPAAEPATPPARDPLRDRIPSGALSGALPWLRVVGNRLVTLAGDPVVLRGVSLLGLERAAPHPEQGFAAGAGLTQPMLESVLAWGVNIIRLAINRGRVLNGAAGLSAWDYITELDEIVRFAAARGAYTLLSLRQLDEATVFGTVPGPNGERLPNYIAPQPDYDAIGMWRVLGERYADEPAVLFDLYTAPHSPLADDLTGYHSDWELWTLWVQMTVAELRRLHPRAICWVSGLAEGTDLSGFPISGTAGDPVPNLVYAVHLYPRRANPWPAMQALARTQPVFVTEWGGGEADVLWGERTALALRGSGLGWVAAHWNAEPFLVRPGREHIAATPFGTVVQRALALSREQAVTDRPILPAALAALSTR